MHSRTWLPYIQSLLAAKQYREVEILVNGHIYISSDEGFTVTLTSFAVFHMGW